MAKILVTGADGFVGRAVLARLLRDHDPGRGHRLRVAVRRPAAWPPGVEPVRIGDLADPLTGGARTDWTAAVAGMDTVVHLAALAHQHGLDAATIDRVNTDAAIALGRAAAAAGARRFVFLSSVKALAEESGARPLRDDDPPRPGDAYGRAKLAAERGLAALDLSLAVLRPPLVHGPGVKANFLSLLRLASGRSRLPLLPLGGMRNQRSLIHVDHLADAIAVAVARRDVTGTFLVADRPALSTSALIMELASGATPDGSATRPPRLITLPAWVWRLAAVLPGSRGYARRLAGSLAVDDQPFRAAFDWQPPCDSRAALRATARACRFTSGQGAGEGAEDGGGASA